jgi:O-acetylhomoserine/O-acetylserine sulfhydrylase
MVEPSPAYHGLRYWASFGPATFIMRARIELLRDVGSCLSPFAAQQLIIGLETLALRAERHAENTAKLAAYFQAHPEYVSWTLWPGSDKHPSHIVAKKYLKRGFGGMLSIGVKGGSEQGSTIVDKLKLVSNVANVGDAKSLAIHPWSTTHEQLSAEEKKDSGVTDDMIRISVGIEHIDDIIADFMQAFQEVYGQ